MTFRIVAKPRAWWPVTWPGVAEDGSIVENSIQLRFLLKKVDEVELLEEEISEKMKVAVAARRAGDDVTSSMVLRDLLKLFAEDWRGVLAENEDPLPWSDENVRLLTNEPNVFDRCVVAYRECMAGGAEIRQGN